MTIAIRVAGPADLPAVKQLVESAYRGDSARGGWTHEADLLFDDRIDLDSLAALVADPASRLLIAGDGEGLVGCVNIADRGDGLAYLGLLCVNPRLQAGGIGRQLIAAAEAMAVETFGARRMEMTVIDRRAELIAYYERRGYTLSGERRPFPMPVEPPLGMVVLVKPLQPAH